MDKRRIFAPVCLLAAMLGSNAMAEAAGLAPLPLNDAPSPASSSPDVATDADYHGFGSTEASPHTLRFALLPARFRHRAKMPADSATAAAHDNEAGMGPMDYRDRAPLITRLKELDGLRLLTFWETRAFAVFFGVSREGLAGLNISQKKDSGQDPDEDETAATDAAPEPTYLAASIERF